MNCTCRGVLLWLSVILPNVDEVMLVVGPE